MPASQKIIEYWRFEGLNIVYNKGISFVTIKTQSKKFLLIKFYVKVRNICGNKLDLLF